MGKHPAASMTMKNPLIFSLFFLLICGIIGEKAHAAETLPAEFTSDGVTAYQPPDGYQRNLSVASKELGRLGVTYEKCHSKGIRNTLKGKPSLLARCLDRAYARFELRIHTLENKGDGLPACANFRQFAADVGEWQQTLTGREYCASPSGAMVDGPILYCGTSATAVPLVAASH